MSGPDDDYHMENEFYDSSSTIFPFREHMPRDFSALVAGGTGDVGRELVNKLSGEGFFERIIVLVRKLKPTDFWNIVTPVEQIIVDYENLDTSIGHLESLTHAFCCLGTSKAKSGVEGFKKVDHDYILNFGAMAKKLQIQTFTITSSMGADVESRFLYTRIKGKTEHELKVLKFKRLIIMQPGILFGKGTHATIWKSCLSKVAPSFMGVKISVLIEALVKTSLEAAYTDCAGAYVFKNDIIRKFTPNATLRKSIYSFQTSDGLCEDVEFPVYEVQRNTNINEFK